MLTANGQAYRQGAEFFSIQKHRSTGFSTGTCEATHPETKHGGARRGSSRQLGDLKDRFAKDTAAKSGKSARSIERDATSAKALGPDLDRIAGTSLDKGRELDALAAMPKPERQAIISRAASYQVRKSRRTLRSYLAARQNARHQVHAVERAVTYFSLLFQSFRPM
jgi:hypothetical protein